MKVPCVSKSAKTKKASSQKKVISGDILQASLKKISSGLVHSKEASSTRSGESKDGVESFLAPKTDGADFNKVVCGGIFPSKSVSGSVSLSKSMPTSDSLTSLEFEHIDSDNVVSTKSIENKTSNILNMSESSKMGGRFFNV